MEWISFKDRLPEDFQMCLVAEKIYKNTPASQWTSLVGTFLNKYKSWDDGEYSISFDSIEEDRLIFWLPVSFPE
jgi:hypothetical protein